MKMNFNVNNGRTIEVFQARNDGPVYATTFNSKGQAEGTEDISAGDFVTMLNWYRYQKDAGNTNLSFEENPQGQPVAPAEGEKMTKINKHVYDFTGNELLMAGILNHIITSGNDTFLDQFDWDEVYPVVDNEEDKRIIGVSYPGGDCQGDIIDDEYITAESTGGNYRGIGD
jgi:hypothetical protein